MCYFYLRISSERPLRNNGFRPMCYFYLKNFIGTSIEKNGFVVVPSTDKMAQCKHGNYLPLSANVLLLFKSFIGTSIEKKWFIVVPSTDKIAQCKRGNYLPLSAILFRRSRQCALIWLMQNRYSKVLRFTIAVFVWYKSNCGLLSKSRLCGKEPIVFRCFVHVCPFLFSSVCVNTMSDLYKIHNQGLISCWVAV